MPVITRTPVVAGQFYPATGEKLRETISALSQGPVSLSAGRQRAIGAVLPHAGYMYSGAVAARTVAACDFNDTFVLIGPNHTGNGQPFSVMTDGSWHTPLGDAEIDSRLAQQMVNVSEYLSSDAIAHRFEHSLEVIVPLLQYIRESVSFVPIAVAHADIAICVQIAQDIYRAAKALSVDGSISIIASSDLTHYESQQSAQKKDTLVIESMLRLDSRELLERVEKHGISMCGATPVAIMIETVKLLGAREASLVLYQTSGDARGDYSSVVGYAGIRIS